MVAALPVGKRKSPKKPEADKKEDAGVGQHDVEHAHQNEEQSIGSG